MTSPPAGSDSTTHRPPLTSSEDADGPGVDLAAPTAVVGTGWGLARPALGVPGPVGREAAGTVATGRLDGRGRHGWRLADGCRAGRHRASGDRRLAGGTGCPGGGDHRRGHAARPG